VTVVASLLVVDAARGQAAPGTTAGGLPVGGLDRPALVAVLERAATFGQGPVEVRLGARQDSIPAGSTGLTVDVEGTADRVLDEPAVSRLWQRFGPGQPRDVAPVLLVNDEALAQTVRRLVRAAEVPRTPAALSYADGRVSLRPAAPGQYATAKSAEAALRSAAAQLPAARPWSWQ
jgi:hypothetical protein